MLRHLSCPNPSASAARVYAYICGLRDQGLCLTGQMESGWCGSWENEMNYLVRQTGRLPALRGLDMIDNDFLGVVHRAVEWWARGGLVTICWHTGPDFSSEYLASKEKDLNWSEALREGTAEHAALLAGMERPVPYLTRLRDAGVPVLWRPFHELDGGWFWWSRGGAERFRQLWRMMYHCYVHQHHLNNLIWVLGYSGNEGDWAAWYPGDEYVDILGSDHYSVGARGDLYQRCAALAPEGMPIVLHECGSIPTRQQMVEEQAPWAWFMTWHTQWLMSEQFNTPQTLREIYRDKSFVTLDALPGLL